MYTTGRLQYFNNWIIAWVDPQISEYYYSLLPKAYNVKRQMNPAHVSVVRKFEQPNKEFWEKYAGQILDIEYNLPIRTDGVYFWLDAVCPRIEDIREELGLVKYLGNFSCYHITIGNVKKIGTQ